MDRNDQDAHTRSRARASFAARRGLRGTLHAGGPRAHPVGGRGGIAVSGPAMAGQRGNSFSSRAVSSRPHRVMSMANPRYIPPVSSHGQGSAPPSSIESPALSGSSDLSVASENTDGVELEEAMPPLLDASDDEDESDDEDRDEDDENDSNVQVSDSDKSLFDGGSIHGQVMDVNASLRIGTPDVDELVDQFTAVLSARTVKPPSQDPEPGHLPGDPTSGDISSTMTGDNIQHAIQQPLPEPGILELYRSLHPTWFIRIFLTLVVFLHTHHHVSFRACGIILFCVHAIFRGAGLIPSEDTSMPITLKTTFSRLKMDDRFHVWPLCSKCHRLFPPDTASSAMCEDCDIALFKPILRSLWRQLVGKDSPPPPPPPPHLGAPIQQLSDLLRDLLSSGDAEDEMEAWKMEEGDAEAYQHMSSGTVWQSARDPSDKTKPFFDVHSTSEELRIGVTFSLDWFSRKSSSYGPSHSSGVMSFSVANFREAIRYRAKNLMLACMTPGPNEPTAAELQQYLRIIVNDLLDLYDNGVIVCTPKYPQGRRIRVILLAIVCDHPAMCKVIGCADHGHKRAPCLKCHVTKEEMFTEKSLQNQFEKRDGEIYRQQCFQYRDLATQEEKDAFFKEHAVFDPMHNLLLGIVKNQWYSRWILNNTLRKPTETNGRELQLIHDFLEEFETPLWAGRLPLRVGEPAGGSLTADEYKFATTVAWPIVIPVVWEEFLQEAQTAFENANKRYDDALKKYETDLLTWNNSIHASYKTTRSTTRQTTKSSKSTKQQPKDKPGKVSDEKPNPPKKPVCRMQKDEPRNFLCLAAALKIFLGSSVYKHMLPRATDFLKDYLLNYRLLYGEAEMKPNHHWAVHLPDQIQSFASVYNFWSFLAERLNKTLKNLNSNNWSGGQIEVSMMREFYRGTQTNLLMQSIVKNPDNPIVASIMTRLMSVNGEALGTIADAAQMATAMHVGIGPITHSSTRLSDKCRAALYNHYNTGFPQVHYPLDLHPPPGTVMLSPKAQFYEWATIDGRRITPIDHSLRDTAGSSIVQVVQPEDGKTYGGQLNRIFHHIQPSINDDTLWAEIDWMIPSEFTPLEDDIWHEFPELEIETWEFQQFYEHGDPAAPPSIVPFKQIHCQLARGTIRTTDPPLWITTSLDRHPDFDIE
ncbi:hypothetical protein AB1N83_007669 [Pleurotus pulmonarius]